MSVRENGVYDFISLRLFKWRHVATFLKLFNINFQRSQTQFSSLRTIIASSKTPLFSCSLFQRKRVQFVTKLIFLVCQDHGKILEHCLCLCPTFRSFTPVFTAILSIILAFKRCQSITRAGILSVIRLSDGKNKTLVLSNELIKV